MSIKLKLAWILSIVATAFASVALLGPGTSASFSDSVDLTQQISTGRTELVITAVDGLVLTDPSSDHPVTDLVTSSSLDLKHELLFRNDGTLDIGTLNLTTSSSPADIAPEMDELVLKVSYTAPDGSTETESHPLPYWLTAPQLLATNLELAPSHELGMQLHLTGELATPDQDPTTELTYRFTASD